jgi:hypothetical protein
MAKGTKIKNMDEIGRVHLFNKRTYSFSIGLIPRIKDLLYLYSDYKKLNIDIEEVDLRNKQVLDFTSNIFPESLITDKELRPYQLQEIIYYLRS